LFFYVKSNYLVSTLAESTTTAVESTDIVESAQTDVESQVLTSVVDVPFPQEANATIANNATICFIIVFFFDFCLFIKLFDFLLEYINIE
jgi:hypothetical protein